MTNHHPPLDLAYVRAVTEAGYRGNVDAVLEALSDADPRVRVAAAGAANRLGTLDGPTFMRLLEDSDVTVRRRAAALAARHDPQAAILSDLVNALLSRFADEWSVAEMSAFALGELGLANPEVTAALEHMALRHADALCRESAVAALGALGVGRATILAALADKAAIRRRAIIALASFEGADIDAALALALQDRDWQVRQAAEDLLTPPSD